MFQDRSTSAGYRFPLNSHPQTSDFHQTCVPPQAKKAAPTQATGTRDKSNAEYSKCDAVTQDDIWKQSVATEERGVKQWSVYLEL